MTTMKKLLAALLLLAPLTVFAGEQKIVELDISGMT